MSDYLGVFRAFTLAASVEEACHVAARVSKSLDSVMTDECCVRPYWKIEGQFEITVKTRGATQELFGLMTAPFAGWTITEHEGEKSAVWSGPADDSHLFHDMRIVWASVDVYPESAAIGNE